MFRLTNRHLTPPPRPYHFITVIGNVGAGKSTLTQHLSRALGFDASYESVADNPFLADFYADQARWAFHLQMYFLSQRYRDICTIAAAGRHHIQDRSIYEDVEIFARSLYESGKMAPREYETYRGLFEHMVSQLIRPSLAIYLTGSLDTILYRVSLRGREMERQVPRAYWEQLHRRYADFMARYDQSPVLEVDVDHFDLFAHPHHLHELAACVRHALGLPAARPLAGVGGDS